jgi:hypothetical protein
VKTPLKPVQRSVAAMRILLMGRSFHHSTWNRSENCEGAVTFRFGQKFRSKDCQPGEIVALAAFLLSEAARSMAGQQIVVCGSVSV